MNNNSDIKSVAVIGAGASGAVTVASLKAENFFERIRVFERRETAGGTWIFDADPGSHPHVHPGSLPAETDPPLDVPETLPCEISPSTRFRWSSTPVYECLTTNVPHIAMCFSDVQFPYGPFVPHYIVRQYIESYFSIHQTDNLLELNTTLEDLSQVPRSRTEGQTQWKLTLRKYDRIRNVDIWWEEHFDAVVLATGHYSVPFVPHVKGLGQYIEKDPSRVVHSKFYRSPSAYDSKRVLVVGNSASGHDISTGLLSAAQLPVYVSRRSKSRWDGEVPPPGIVWKPIIKEYEAGDRIIFADDSYLDDIDMVIYCTGYKPSFPFWNHQNNKYPLWDYQSERLRGNFWHTFFRDFPTLGIVGVPRVLTFRSLEYQAIALARLWSRRNRSPLPSYEEQVKWEKDRAARRKDLGKKFHEIEWDSGETAEFLDFLFKVSGVGTLWGEGKIPPVFTPDVVWAIEHVHKYPEPPESYETRSCEAQGQNKESDSWVIVEDRRKGRLSFI